MASRYGINAYSRNLYSDANVDVAGALTLSTSFAAVFTRSHPLAGAFSVVPSLSGLLNPYRLFFSSAFSVAPTITGVLLDINNFSGTINVAPLLTGDLFKGTAKHLEAALNIIPLLSGTPVLSASFLAELIVQVDLVGDPFIGKFWDPIVPDILSWAPEPEGVGPWTPESETIKPWVAT